MGKMTNMATALAVYALICKQTTRPFVLPRTKVQWGRLTDMTDARQLPKQQLGGLRKIT